MNTRLMATVSLLVVAILAFTGLAFQTVPVGTTQTITQESAQTQYSYQSYVMETYTSEPIWTHTSTEEWSNIVCVAPTDVPSACTAYYLGSTIIVLTQYAFARFGINLTLTTTFVNTETMTSITESSTNFVPAAEAVGLTDDLYWGLAIVVIAVLGLAVVWTLFRGHPKQAKLSIHTGQTNGVSSGAELR